MWKLLKRTRKKNFLRDIPAVRHKLGLWLVDASQAPRDAARAPTSQNIVELHDQISGQITGAGIQWPYPGSQSEAELTPHSGIIPQEILFASSLCNFFSNLGSIFFPKLTQRNFLRRGGPTQPLNYIHSWLTVENLRISLKFNFSLGYPWPGVMFLLTTNWGYHMTLYKEKLPRIPRFYLTKKPWPSWKFKLPRIPRFYGKIKP